MTVGGGGAVSRRAGGAAAGVSVAVSAAASGSGSTMSRCGLPHLWQKRASGGSCAPQLQNSGIFAFSVATAGLWAAVTHTATCLGLCMLAYSLEPIQRPPATWSVRRHDAGDGRHRRVGDLHESQRG